MFVVVMYLVKTVGIGLLVLVGNEVFSYQDIFEKNVVQYLANNCSQ